MNNKKKLYKDSKNGQVSGVCAGLAEYLDMDVSLVRILTVVIGFFTGIGIVPYLVLMVVLPEKEDVVVEEDNYGDYEPKKKTKEQQKEDDLYEFNEEDYKI